LAGTDVCDLIGASARRVEAAMLGEIVVQQISDAKQAAIRRCQHGRPAEKPFRWAASDSLLNDA
jgi:hypothetical protein